jgi:metallophosphoesterase superfamily enzyme
VPVSREQAAKTRLLFMPAFNELAGYDISRIVKDPFSPLSRCMDSSSAEIILADGTYIGPLNSLVVDEDD